jgi:hypothetical protein
MHEHAVLRDVIDVVALDFKVEDGFGVGEGDDPADDGGAVESSEVFPFFQFVRADERLAIFGPELRPSTFIISRIFIPNGLTPSRNQRTTDVLFEFLQILPSRIQYIRGNNISGCCDSA